jgi:hypothetical protein
MALTVKVTNKSKAFLSFWHVDASAFDRAGTFLANGMTVDSNLRPGDSVVKQMAFSNVNSGDIGRWVLRLKGLTVETESGDRLSEARQTSTSL